MSSDDESITASQRDFCYAYAFFDARRQRRLVMLAIVLTSQFLGESDEKAPHAKSRLRADTLIDAMRTP